MTAEPTHPGTLSSRALAYEQGYDPADEGPGVWLRPCPNGCGSMGVLHGATCPPDPWQEVA